MRECLFDGSVFLCMNICLTEVCFVREHLFDGSVFCA